MVFNYIFLRYCSDFFPYNLRNITEILNCTGEVLNFDTCHRQFLIHASCCQVYGLREIKICIFVISLKIEKGFKD